MFVLMSGHKDRVSEILETHFCEVLDAGEYESHLRNYVREYLSELDLGKLVEYHKALGDENRLGIMKLLEFREMCVCELAAALGTSQPNLTHHIKKLERAGLVKSEKRGKWVYYRIED